MNNNLSNFLKTDNCVGCSACKYICPSNAIDILLNEQGFYKAMLNEMLCTSCGSCLSVCPVLNKKESAIYDYPEALAAWSKRDGIRLKSSSGGIFYELAYRFIKDKSGAVYGAVFDDNYLVKHDRVTWENEKNLFCLIGSKYVHGGLEGVYPRIEKDIKSQKRILFVGLPCQVAALKNVIIEKNLSAEGVYLVDLVCHGVPSLKLYKLWLKNLSKGRMIKGLSFRDKSCSWENFRIVLEFEDGSKYAKSHKRDPFYYGYLKNLYLNYHCYNCSFSQIPREGDITLGDYWGVSGYLDKAKGVSIVLLNNKQGKRLFGELKNITFYKADLNDAIKYNPRIAKGEISLPKIREYIFEKVSKNNFSITYFNKIIRRIRRKEILYYFLRGFKKLLKGKTNGSAG